MKNWQILYSYTDREISKNGRWQTVKYSPFRLIRQDTLDQSTPTGKILLKDAGALYDLLDTCSHVFSQDIRPNDKGHWADVMLALTDEETGKTYKRQAIIDLNKTATVPIPFKDIPYGGLYQMWEDQTQTKDNQKLVKTLQNVLTDWQRFDIRKQLLEQRIEKNGADIDKAVDAAGGWVKYETAYKRQEREMIIDTIYRWLEPYGVSLEKAEKIYKTAGNNYIYELYRNTFSLLIKQIEIPYTTAYKIYKAMHERDGGFGAFEWMQDIGYGEVAGLRQEIERRGSTYMTTEQVRDWQDTQEARTGHRPLQTVGFPFEYTQIISIIKGIGLGHSRLIKAELDIAHKIRIINETQRPAECNAQEVQRQVEATLGIELGEEQAAAFVKIMSSKGGLHIVTGGPGTGKTQLIKAILEAWEKLYPDEQISLCAPTGRAAQRMAEVTGKEASTIHKLLDFRPYQDEPSYNASHTLSSDLVIVDESSMIDVELFRYLIMAIRQRATVILLGDSDQLESVGPGAVLRDLLDPENDIEKSRLVKVFRQAAQSKIIENAGKIRNGNTDLSVGDDFHIYKSASALQTIQTVRDLTGKFRNGDPYAMQVLCPTRKGKAGINALNEVLQDWLNGGTQGIKAGNREFRTGDKVLMNTNNASVGYYNGDIGIIKNVNPDEMTIQIRDEEITLLREEWDDVELAYATTIHKSQGSEYDTVIIALPAEYPLMMARNLIYTAVTRAKKEVHIVYEEDMLQRSVRSFRASNRKTMLGAFIKDHSWQEMEG